MIPCIAGLALCRIIIFDPFQSMDSSRDTVGTETDVDSACVPKMDKRNSCNTDSNRYVFKIWISNFFVVTNAK